MAMEKFKPEDTRKFSQLYSKNTAEQIRAAVDMPLCYLGGVQSMENINGIMDAGFDTIALGRALIFDPNLINDLRSGAQSETACTACNQCVMLMYTPGGTACIDPNGTRGHAAELNVIRASTG